MSRRRFRRDPINVASRLGRYRRMSSTTSELGRVREAWPGVVGDDAARQTVVVRRSQAGVVTVACASAAWAQELDLRRDRIVMSLTRALPEVAVTGIRFVIGDHVMPIDEAPVAPKSVTPTARERAEAEAETPELDDPSLRELLIRARAAQIALERERKALLKARKPGRRSRRI